MLINAKVLVNKESMDICIHVVAFHSYNFIILYIIEYAKSNDNPKYRKNRYI